MAMLNDGFAAVPTSKVPTNWVDRTRNLGFLNFIMEHPQQASDWCEVDRGVLVLEWTEVVVPDTEFGVHSDVKRRIRSCSNIESTVKGCGPHAKLGVPELHDGESHDAQDNDLKYYEGNTIYDKSTVAFWYLNGPKLLFMTPNLVFIAMLNDGSAAVPTSKVSSKVADLTRNLGFLNFMMVSPMMLNTMT
ncbi:hypothetical protein RJ640_023135 [Escallonia rubra]|uniref:Uncharacterized protein n=1 Tax=Escallonia rubra TaxID=112253 RepID=A0AA88RIW8_9ASTE|nr:hypothetical protein RJ640_023135 [Escallonia rubra]